MHKFLSEEKVEVAKEDRLPKGLKMLLRCYEFDVKPEMVSSVVSIAVLFALYLPFSVTLYTRLCTVHL
jgi:hypothetical protein